MTTGWKLSQGTLIPYVPFIFIALALNSGCHNRPIVGSVPHPSPDWLSPRCTVQFQGTLYTVARDESVLREADSGRLVYNFQNEIGGRMQMLAGETTILAAVTNRKASGEVPSFRLEYIEFDGTQMREKSVIESIAGVPSNIFRSGSMDYVRAEVYTKPISEDYHSVPVIYTFKGGLLIGASPIVGATFSGDSLAYIEASGKATVVGEFENRSFSIPRSMLPVEYTRSLALGEGDAYYISRGELIANRKGHSSVVRKVSSSASLFSIMGAEFLHDVDGDSHSLFKLVDGTVTSSIVEYSIGSNFVLDGRKFYDSGYVDIFKSDSTPRMKFAIVDVKRATTRIKTYDNPLISTQIFLWNDRVTLITSSGLETIPFE